MFRRLVLPALRRHFDRVWLRVDDGLPSPEHGPLVVYLNHPSWWDGYAAMLIDRVVLRKAYLSYVMMDQAQLQRYSFFRWCGAFSVDRTSPRGAPRPSSTPAVCWRATRTGLCGCFSAG